MSGTITLTNLTAQHLITLLDGSPELDALLDKHRPKRRIIEKLDSVSRVFNTSWAWGFRMGADAYSGGSRLLVDISVPCRKDSNTWGGLYTQLHYTLDGGTNWVSLGHSGHDGVMVSTASAIATYTKKIIVDALPAANFNLEFLLTHRTWLGTTTVNGAHDLSGARWATAVHIEELFK